MLRDRLIDAAVRLGVDGQLRSMRAALFPQYRYDRAESWHLRRLLESTLKEDSQCIDIGAFRGRVLAEIVRVAPRGKHIAYEPIPHLHRYLVERYPSVDVRLAAVSNEEGESSFAYVKNVPGRSGFRRRSFGTQQNIETLTVRVETLDTNLPEGYAPALIKIDVEGAERFVIEGALKTISTYRPIIIFEHGKGGADYYNTEPHHIYDLLHNQAGLQIFDLEGNGPYTLAQFEEIYASNACWDFVARP